MSHQIFFAVIDAIGVHQKLQIILVLREAFKRIGNAGARKALKDVVPVSLEPGVLAEPERRVDRQGVNVR